MSNSPSLQFLLFKLSGHEFALPLERVLSVYRPLGITPVPYMPTYFKGLMNLRGQIVSVIDLVERLKIMGQRDGDTAEACVVVVNTSRSPQGILVDSVTRVVEYQSVQDFSHLAVLDVESLGVMEGVA